MKKTILLTGILLIFLSSFSSAQKFGYLDTEAIIKLMPETEVAQAKFEGQVKELEAQLEEMQVEYNNLYQTYLDNEELVEGATGKWSKAIKQVKESEIMQLQERITTFQGTAQATIEEMQVELYQPIYDKVDIAVSAVAKEKGYFCVYDINSVLYINPEKCDDISADIKTKLGITQ